MCEVRVVIRRSWIGAPQANGCAAAVVQRRAGVEILPFGIKTAWEQAATVIKVCRSEVVGRLLIGAASYWELAYPWDGSTRVVVQRARVGAALVCAATIIHCGDRSVAH